MASSLFSFFVVLLMWRNAADSFICQPKIDVSQYLYYKSDANF